MTIEAEKDMLTGRKMGIKEKIISNAKGEYYNFINKGDIVKGALTEVYEKKTKHGLAEYAVIETEAGNVEFVITAGMKPFNLEENIGQYVSIECLGLVKNEATGNRYKDFEVLVEEA